MLKDRTRAHYGRLGWQEFSGRLLVTQRGQPSEFTFNRVMVCPVRGGAGGRLARLVGTTVVKTRAPPEFTARQQLVQE